MAFVDFPKDAPIRVLELGCGTGTLANRIISSFPNAFVYAIDFSPAMLEVAKEKIGSTERVKFLEKSIFDVAVDDFPFFDLIVSTFVLHNYDETLLYQSVFGKANKMLAVGGKLIYGDLISSPDESVREAEKELQIFAMRECGLPDKEIMKWLSLLDEEDFPLPVPIVKDLLSTAGFDSISVEQIGLAAVFVAAPPVDILQVKAELLIHGVRIYSSFIGQIYDTQNPGGSPKTGNNGIFVTLDDKYDVLISFRHSNNQVSPYSLVSQNGVLQLKKNEVELALKIAEKKVPEWYYTKIQDIAFSDCFLYEGDKYLHIAYKCCDIKDEQRCSFCSVSRRENDSRDKSAEEICAVLEPMLQSGSVPDSFHFCIGGGTYLPLTDNVKFVKKIIDCIKKNRDGKNPIWVEMIPPSTNEIEELVKAGATSFGFNIEVFNNDLRQIFCSGKNSIAPVQNYLDAFDKTRLLLGEDKVGSCLIVGLDSQAAIRSGIDILVEHRAFPCILPLKVFDGAAMQLSPERLAFLERDFISLSQYAALKVREKGLDVSQNEGCMNCPCCTVIHDIINHY
jgi:ubiquinone/menaquinone biosynthesis C-methylase UbiE